MWLVRAGKFGEHEPRFFEDRRIYLTWETLQEKALNGAKNYDEIKALVREAHPNEPERRLGAWAGQIWAFVLEIKPGDIIVTPRKGKSVIAFGEVTGDYSFLPAGAPMYRQAHDVNWVATDVPRTTIDSDLLDSFGSILTICRISRNLAEERVRKLVASLKAGGPGTVKPATPTAPEDTVADGEVDLEQAGRDRIVRFVRERFTGHGFAYLVDAVLRAQGYATYLSPPGPDGGIDILAAPGALGFGSPRLCVQVKSGSIKVDRPTHDQLLGVMQKVGAEHGLLVAWGGFKDTVDRERGPQFFRVRLWDADDLVNQILEHYEQLPADVRAEIPLKRIWTVATPDDGD